MSQGTNRYIPPDYDPKKHSTLNAHQGKKHALGKRAAKIDQGILVTRFELPFNIWCGTCNNHIGAGVRYNAQKSKVGNYHSTPIFAFRCKCHLCDGWFVIQTDPQNAQYVVTEGARKKEETWDPTENGGYAVFDTEAPSASEGGDGDAFAALEKDSAQQTAVRVQRSRLTELGDSSARISADPYAVSKSLRDRFRIEKKEALAKQRRDEGLLDRYGLDPDLDLGNEDSKDEIDQVATAKWTAARENRGLPASAVPKPDLGSTIQKNTAARKFDVFEAEAVPRVRLKRKSEVKEVEVAPPKPPPPAVGLLAGYASSDDE